jgi:glycerol 2-dehydrogenase (NADP+)
VLAKSVNPARIDANKNLIELDQSDMDTIAKYSSELEKNKAFVRYVYPPFGVQFGFPDKL